jgi:hypothetical protein
MADNFKNGRATDRSRVSMNEEQEIRYWTEYLGCTRGELAAAVARVGSSPDAVRREVYRHWGYGTFRVGDAPQDKNAIASATSQAFARTELQFGVQLGRLTNG